MFAGIRPVHPSADERHEDMRTFHGRKVQLRQRLPELARTAGRNLQTAGYCAPGF